MSRLRAMFPVPGAARGPSRFLFPALALCLLPRPGQALETMRIAVGPAGSEVRLAARSLAFGEDEENARFTPLRGGRAVVRLERGRLVLNGAPLPLGSVRFRAGELPDAGLPGKEPIHLSALSVRGDLVVRAHRGTLQLINVIVLEEYLVGVLGSEMPKSFPEQALRAQAVAARTYALFRKLQGYGQPYHLESSVLGQVYGGLRVEDPRTRAAVDDTRGLVLTHELAPAETYFHSSCGGRTESGLEALGRELPYLTSVECPCGALRQSRWEATFQAEELERTFGRGEGGALSVAARSSSGRVQRLKLGTRFLDGVTFRERAGYSKVRSLWFQVAEQPGRFVLSGQGSGHGAGLCQWGAKLLAEKGWDFRQILEHYYPGTELQLLY